ncbi:hypothetical protein RJ640_007481 [Escallonia rubra]|uniref:Uncharacterized protein n=1 Tax=Escallonia rubra TaxID=112253 RepID=A0AA88RYI5_9ASTE|nr:hypothetical protein RJ640_007481 [Escallonia rubra]
MVPSQPATEEVSKSSGLREKNPSSEEVRKTLPIFKHVLVSHQAEGQSPFIELTELKEAKVVKVLKKVDVQVLKEESIVPLTTIGTVRIPLKELVEPSWVFAKHLPPPSVKAYEDFDSKAQRLLENLGNDCESPEALGELSPELMSERVHRLNEIRKKLRQQGHQISPPRTVLVTSLIDPSGIKPASDSIKKYLHSSPVLGAPMLGKPLIFYIAAQEESLGAILEKDDEDKKENVLCYLSRRAAIKGRVIVDILAKHPILADWEISKDFPDEEVFFIEAFQPLMMFLYGVALFDGL